MRTAGGFNGASLQQKKSGAFIVRWRVDGRMKGKQFQSRDDAVAFKEQLESEERARRILADTPGIPGWDSEGPFPAEDEAYGVAAYIRAMVDADHELKETTRALYLRNLRVHVEDTPLGRTDIRSVTPDDLRAWWTALDAGLGARRNVHQLISKAFSRALVVGDIDTLPLRRAPEVKRPSKKRQDEVEPLTVEEIEALADAALQARRGQVGPTADMTRKRDRLGILVMAYGGLRAGEVGGLRGQDMTRTADGHCQVRLRQQVVRQTGQPPYTSTLKTDAARRTVTIPCSVWDELQAFLDEYPPATDGRVFHKANGEMLAHNDWNHAVQAAGNRIGLDVNAHQLRHTAVSLWIEDGANPVDVQRMVGHSDIRMTLGTYGHLFTHGGPALAASMERRREAHRKEA